MRKFSAPSKSHAGRTDHFAVGTMRDFAETAERASGFVPGVTPKMVGYMSMKEAAHAARNGHLPSVEASDAFLKEVEQFIRVPSARHTIVDDVVGAVPNIPAYLAGQPLTMRRKQKMENEGAPIALVCNGSSSIGISANALQKRGAAVMALARALSSVRLVELYLCGTHAADNGRNCFVQFWQIETAPMDLARAAFMLTHPVVTRGIQFARVYEEGYGFNGKWPYSNPAPLSTANMEEKVRLALPHITDTICIPAITIQDQTASDPIAWLKEKLLIFGGES